MKYLLPFILLLTGCASIRDALPVGEAEEISATLSYGPFFNVALGAKEYVNDGQTIMAGEWFYRRSGYGSATIQGKGVIFYTDE